MSNSKLTERLSLDTVIDAAAQVNISSSVLYDMTDYERCAVKATFMNGTGAHTASLSIYQGTNSLWASAKAYQAATAFGAAASTLGSRTVDIQATDLDNNADYTHVGFYLVVENATYVSEATLVRGDCKYEPV